MLNLKIIDLKVVVFSIQVHDFFKLPIAHLLFIEKKLNQTKNCGFI